MKQNINLKKTETGAKMGYKGRRAPQLSAWGDTRHVGGRRGLSLAPSNLGGPPPLNTTMGGKNLLLRVPRERVKTH